MKDKNAAQVWIVELWVDQDANCPHGWNATVGIGLTRHAGRATLKEWQKRLPADRLRLASYERTE